MTQQFHPVRARGPKRLDWPASPQRFHPVRAHGPKRQVADAEDYQSLRGGVVGGDGWLALHSTITEMWARLIARAFEHGHRAVCGGGLFEVELDPEKHFL